VRPASRAALLALLGAACGARAPATVELTEVGSAAAAVASALATLPAEGGYTLEVADLSAVQPDDGGFRQGSVRLGPGLAWVAPAGCGPEEPASCSTMGSRGHARLEGAGEVRLDEPRQVLGLHLALSARQAASLELLTPEPGGGLVLGLPTFQVLVTGLDASGRPTRTVRAVPAAATYAGTRVDREWTWVDASPLGVVWGLRLEVRSPLPGLGTILLDNLALSADFHPDPAFFTIGLIPDSQKYVETEALLPLFDAQARFLAEEARAEHLVFISGLGDIVEHGDREEEWARADAVLARLDGSAIPHGWVVGNHDYLDQWAHPERGAPGYLRHFPVSRFAAAPWWVGAAPDGLSSAQRFPTPAGDFLYLHLSVDSPPPTLSWAQGVLDAHHGLPTLISTHAYLRESGRIPVPYLASVGGPPWPGLSADQVFAQLVAPNDQVFMVTCGHISAEHTQTSLNAAGHPVHEVLQDYQNREQGGEGFLRLMRFYPARKEVRMVTYSPGLGTYEVDGDSHFTLPLDLGARFR
jgi:hypothetical protein